MRKLTKFYQLLLVGVATAVVYGLLVRSVLGLKNQVATVTFFFIVPALMGFFPLLFSSKELLRKRWVLVVSPLATVIIFCFVMLIMGMENALCLLVLIIPYFFLSLIGAWVGAFIYRRVQLSRERKRQNLLVIAVIPFLLASVEGLIQSPVQTWSIESSVMVDASPETIWKNIVAVKTIQPQEYHPGFFNRLGVPRPLRASVDAWAKGGHRTGEFDGGLVIREIITRYHQDRHIAFDIAIDTATVSNDVFQQHVLKGAYFSFVDAAYTLEPQPGGSTKLVLSSGYRLRSKFNFYGKWWGNLILRDFQVRLLEVIKNRCEAEADKFAANTTVH